MAEAVIHLPDVIHMVTLKAKITGDRAFALRIWLGCKVMALAALIIGCGIEIDTDGK